MSIKGDGPGGYKSTFLWILVVPKKKSVWLTVKFLEIIFCHLEYDVEYDFECIYMHLQYIAINRELHVAKHLIVNLN